jgi:hypothetical protein
MSDDPRCCGSGTCIIDAEGRCWCGQRWDGDRLVDSGPTCSEPDTLAPKDATAQTAGAPRHQAAT